MPLARKAADVTRRGLWVAARRAALTPHRAVACKNRGPATCSIDKVMFNNYLSSYSYRSLALQGHNND
ncbi:hypothetical protein DENIT_90352 [Pseudomonas veronii]|nr:hypothetical protein DENIT_90352 [Pseudomonas veronii]